VASATPRRRRVLLVETNEDGTTGGSYRALCDLVRRLDRRRFEARVVLYQRGPAAAEIEAAGVRVEAWDAIREAERQFSGPQHPWRRLRGVFEAIRGRAHWMRAAGIDLVHLNNSPGVGFDDWLPAARLAGVPCMTHLRGPFPVAGSGVGRWLQQRFDAVIAVSRWMAGAAAAAGIPADRIRVVYDGVDRDALAAALRRQPAAVRAELGLAADDFVVLLAGHLRPWKGQRLALEALVRTSPRLRSRLRLVLAGAAPPAEAAYRGELEAFARDAGLGACVRFLGERRDVPDLMRAADVVLHASTSPEPFGLVVTEAMALGRPVVAARLGGPCEIVTEGTGLLFDPSRPDELTFLLEQLYEQPQLRERLGAAGLSRAADFDIRHTVAGVERCYAGLLGLSHGADADPTGVAAGAASAPGATRGTIGDTL